MIRSLQLLPFKLLYAVDDVRFLSCLWTSSLLSFMIDISAIIDTIDTACTNDLKFYFFSEIAIQLSTEERAINELFKETFD